MVGNSKSADMSCAWDKALKIESCAWDKALLIQTDVLRGSTIPEKSVRKNRGAHVNHVFFIHQLPAPKVGG